MLNKYADMSVAHWMTLCLQNYYQTRNPFGRSGDFITAPEISQMFGELIAASIIDKISRDYAGEKKISLVEVGPGKGTLMKDMIRVFKKLWNRMPEIWLIETSQRLRTIQADTLWGEPINWTNSIQHIPDDAPLFIVANEFFDALPINQYVYQDGNWHLRRITKSKEGLAFVVAEKRHPDYCPDILINAQHGDIFETSPWGRHYAQRIARRIARQGGCGLFIDYGHAQSGFGDTLQAVGNHSIQPVFARPGEHDITTHVDFAGLSDAVQKAGCIAHKTVTQGFFLNQLGIFQRATMLAKNMPECSEEIMRAAERLTSAKEMGNLFKVMAITPHGFPPPAGCIA